MAEPEIVVENVRSRILFKLSVARIAKLVEVSWVTKSGLPEMTPLDVIDSPGDKYPLSKVYVILVAGAIADALKVMVSGNPAG